MSPYLKQALLFLLAVVLPSSALVLLSLRMMTQERELVEKRTSERGELAGRKFAEALSRELREVADRVVAMGPAQVRGGEWTRLDPGLALVAVVEKDRLVLPWERNPQAETFAEIVRQAPFADLLAAGQRFEFREGDFRLALASYREAAQLDGVSAQLAYAALAVARVLFKMGAAHEAEPHLEPLLKAPLNNRDEFDVPISFYAAGQLLHEGRQMELVFSTLAGALGSPDIDAPVTQVPGVSGALGLSPAAACMARDYLEELRRRWPERKEQIEKTLRQLHALMALHEQGEQLKADFPVVRAAMLHERDGSGPAGRWTLYGTELWLASIIPLRESEESALLAVSAVELAKRALKGGALDALGDAPQLVRGPRAQGVWLGEAFPNLQLILPASALVAQGSEPQRLHAALIALVLGITLFGAYLWWRDTRRELKLAEMRSDFVSSVSHELKTPLTSVQMLAETLRIRDVAPKERNEYLDLILSESERLGRLLKNVLDFSQIEKGTKVYELEPVELGPVIEAAVRLVQRPLREKNLALELRSEGAAIVLRADRDALEQAVLNLLYNAIKYSHKDGRIELRAERDGDEALIHVRDYGVGIHPRDQQRIFERFYRAPEDHNRRIPGTGLGLSLVKHIVASHGGRVTVESAPGQGSTFAIHLPVREGG